MAFMNAALETVHAHDTSGVYCTIPAKTVEADLLIQHTNVQSIRFSGWKPTVLWPARVDSLPLFEDASTELGGRAALLQFLQAFPRIFAKQETLQRVKEIHLHELIFLLRTGLGLQTEVCRHLLLQVLEQLHSDVCSFQPFLQRKINLFRNNVLKEVLVFHFPQSSLRWFSALMHHLK